MKEYITPELVGLIIALYGIFKIVQCICDTVVAKEYIKMIVNKNVLEKRPTITNNRYIPNENNSTSQPKNKLVSNYDE